MTAAEQWIQQGKEEGHYKGLQEGRQEGEALTLLRLIERKFGVSAREAYRKRIEAANDTALSVWTDRILEAERVEDLFIDG